MSFATNFPAEYVSRLNDSIESGYPVIVTSHTPSLVTLNTRFVVISLPDLPPAVIADRVIFSWGIGDTTDYLEVSEPSTSHTVFNSDLIRVTNPLSGTVFFSPAICQGIDSGRLAYSLKDIGSGKQVVIPFRGDTIISFQQSMTADLYTTNVGGFEAKVSGV